MECRIAQFLVSTGTQDSDGRRHVQIRPFLCILMPKLPVFRGVLCPEIRRKWFMEIF